jgi:ATP-dependent helicase/nuclease subunit B
MRSSKISAPNYEACIASAIEFVSRHDETSEVLLVAPTTEAANEVVRRAFDGALIGVHTITLRNLARVLAESRLCAAGRAEISAVARQAVIARIATAIRLDYFAPVASAPGFPKALSRTIRELRLHDVSPEGDLKALLQSYEEELEQHQLADVATIFRTALRVVEERNHPFCGLPVVFLDAPVRHKLEQQLVEALTALSDEALHLTLDGTFDPAGVEIFSASSESLECVEIARRVHQLAREGVSFDQIAVVSRDAGRLQPLLEEAFTRAGIPIWFSSGCMRPSSAGRALLALLHCAAEGLSASRFLEYLSLGQAPGVRSHGWERMIVNAAVSGGLSRWKQRLERLAREAAPNYAKSVDDLTAFVIPLLEDLASWSTTAIWREWLDRIQSLASKYVYDNQALTGLLDELEPLADIGPVDLRSVIDLLSEHLRNIRVPTNEPRYGKVFAGSIEDVRGMAFHSVFLPGLCEGSFPKLLREDPLLLNEQRAKLGMAIVDEADERDLLRQAAACAGSRFIVSYSRIELGTGRARVPSLYAYEVMRAARGSAFDPRELQKEAEGRVQTTLAWPAPHAVQEAIDDTEYDLGVLREPFETQPAIPGAAAYLGEVNPMAVNVLRHRWRRWRDAWNATDAVFDDIEAQIMLKDRRVTRHAYSPTSLQQFAMCPYRFYLSSVLRLRPLPDAEPAQRMDPRTRGEIFHRTQARVMEELSMPVEDAAAAYSLLESALADVSQEEADNHPPAIRQVWVEEIARLRADLRGWLSEYLRASGEWIPLHVEHRFESINVLEGFQLTGAIDVIERHTSGTIRVIDHKTGTPPKEAPQTIGKGEVLQPILYALAAEQIVGQPVPRGRLYYATLRGNYRTIDIIAGDAARDRMRALLTYIDEAIDNGAFHTLPRKDACGRCDYGPVCGPYEEERSGRKPALRTLTQIRNTL